MKYDRFKLKLLLLRKNICQYQFAKQLNITETYISKVLRGRLQPSKDLWKKMKQILNCK